MDSTRTLSVKFDIAGGKSATVSFPHCKSAAELKDDESATQNVISSLMDCFTFTPAGIAPNGVRVTTKSTEILF